MLSSESLVVHSLGKNVTTFLVCWNKSVQYLLKLTVKEVIHTAVIAE